MATPTSARTPPIPESSPRVRLVHAAAGRDRAVAPGQLGRRPRQPLEGCSRTAVGGCAGRAYAGLLPAATASRAGLGRLTYITPLFELRVREMRRVARRSAQAKCNVHHRPGGRRCTSSLGWVRSRVCCPRSIAHESLEIVRAASSTVPSDRRVIWERRRALHLGRGGAPDQPHPCGVGDCLGAGGGVELAIDGVRLALDGVGGDVQPLTDLSEGEVRG
jgi:hypothetical protein